MNSPQPAKAIMVRKPATIDVEDVYDAVIADIKEIEGTKYKSEEPQLNYIWEFAVKTPSGGTVEVAGWTPVDSYKLIEWICTWEDMREQYNKIPEEDVFGFDPDDFIGRACRVDIVIGDNGKARVKDLRPPR